MNLVRLLFLSNIVFLSSGVYGLNKSFCDSLTQYKDLSLPGFDIYYPRKGDTLQSISRAYNRSVRSIIDSSRLNQFNDVQAEFCLIIPRAEGLIWLGYESDEALRRRLAMLGVTNTDWHAFNKPGKLWTKNKYYAVVVPYARKVLLDHDSQVQFGKLLPPFDYYELSTVTKDPFIGRVTRHAPYTKFSSIINRLVYAVESGMVESVKRCEPKFYDCASVSGKCYRRPNCHVKMTITHPNGTQSLYKINATSIYVSPGDEVSAGQVVAAVRGSATCSTATTMYFSIKLGNKHLDLRKYFGTRK